MTAWAQPDLFGEWDAAQERAARRAADAAAWAARFERAEWVARWDCADGTKAGTPLLGWRCPDDDCGEVEPTAFALSINHGFDPDVPGRQPFTGTCTKLRLLANQAQYDQRRWRHED